MLLFMDSFDHYATADILTKYTSGGAVIGSGGRYLYCMNPGTSYDLYKNLGANHPTLIIGYAFYINSLRPGTAWFYFQDAATIQGPAAGSTMGFDSAVRLFYGGMTGDTVFTYGRWYYLELKVVFHQTAGEWELRINGNREMGASGVDTCSAANEYANGWSWHGSYSAGSGAGNNVRIDDLYVCNGLGSVNNNFLGDIRVVSLFPNGNGSHSDFVGSDSNSTDNYLLVDENDPGPNDDTDYVESNTIDAIDTYNYGSLYLADGSVNGIQLLPYMKKSDAGARAMKSVVRLSSTEQDSVDPYTLESNYKYFLEIRETKPGGGVWTIADVNALEAGPKVAS